eukprot:gnl/TRDRNA2_/TRDRNA2_74199_c0_seq1.p1 gnl/TRDRNA2_/TRDRNA2_74199_c0~~gnl/TRDRNA2_/TRDRNA2_74199_c0_seq1.p1  ORF type:complete len:542 (+),score=59.40 gnl/TRDRNA2_/TRDRNA2_74199_c0_seq1:69-1628(+)
MTGELIPGYKGAHMVSDQIPVHVLNRPLFSRTLVCSGQTEDTCQACSEKTGEACWHSEGNEMKLGVDSFIAGRRFQILMHVVCPSAHVGFFFTEQSFTLDGKLKFFWDGTEVTKDNGFGRHSTTLTSKYIENWNVRYSPLKKSEGKKDGEENGRVAWIMDVGRAGGHDLMIELDHEGPNAGEVVLGGLSFFFPAKYTVCMDAKACLKDLGGGKDGLELRNSNAIQLACLQAAMSTIAPGSACHRWRACLKKGGSGHSTSLLEMMQAAGVGKATTTSQTTTVAPPVLLSISQSRGKYLCPVASGRHDTWRCKGEPIKSGSGMLWGNLGRHGFATCMGKCKADPQCKVLVHHGKQQWCTKLQGKCEQVTDSQYRVKSWIVRKWPCPKHPIKLPLDGPMKKHANVTRCIDPETSDPEAWDCDCHKEMVQLCHEISNEHQVSGFSMAMCMRAQLCTHSRVCQTWKDTHCNEVVASEIADLITAHEEKVGAEAQLALLTRARGNHESASSTSKFDDTSRAKRCK